MSMTVRFEHGHASRIFMGILLVGVVFLFYGDDRTTLRRPSLPTGGSGNASDPLPVVQVGLSREEIGQTSPSSSASAGEIMDKGRRVRNACRRFFVPRPVAGSNGTCQRGHLFFLQRSGRDGLGHQITEILFGLDAARRLGRLFVWEPFPNSSRTYHLEQYDEFSAVLGLNGLFDAFDSPRWADVQKAVEWQEIKYTVGEDVQRYSSNAPHANCAVGYFAKGYHHCTKEGHYAMVNNRRAFVPLNCFQARVSAFAQEVYRRCFRTVAQEMGTLFTISRRKETEANKAKFPRLERFLDSLSNPDVVTIVWHVRVGDLIPHRPDDPHFRRVASALRNMTNYSDPPPPVNFFLIGGGSAAYVLTELHASKKRPKVNVNDPHYTIEMFEPVVREAALAAWNESGVTPNVTSLAQLPIVESFLAMANADVVVGSGSSLVHAAGLFSDRALFFSHAKATVGGDPHGVFLMADSIDLLPSGEVRDSMGRLRAALFGLKQRKLHDDF